MRIYNIVRTGIVKTVKERLGNTNPTPLFWVEFRTRMKMDTSTMAIYPSPPCEHKDQYITKLKLYVRFGNKYVNLRVSKETVIDENSLIPSTTPLRHCDVPTASVNNGSGAKDRKYDNEEEMGISEMFDEVIEHFSHK